VLIYNNLAVKQPPFCPYCGERIKTVPFIELPVFISVLSEKPKTIKGRFPLHKDCAERVANEIAFDLLKYREKKAKEN
jgi:hypothetical protein